MKSLLLVVFAVVFSAGLAVADECSLCVPAESGNLSEVKRLLNSGVEVNTADKDGWTALMVAAWYGNAEVVRELLGAGAGVNAANNEGLTILMLAAVAGHVEVVRELLRAGAEVNAKIKQVGMTALMLVVVGDLVVGDQIDIIKVLLVNGANPDLTDIKGKSVWDSIEGKKRLELVFNKSIEEWYENQ